MPIVLIENFRAVFYAPFYAACALGAYEAEGIEVELKFAAELGKALQAVTAGAGQVSWGGPLRIMAALRFVFAVSKSSSMSWICISWRHSGRTT